MFSYHAPSLETARHRVSAAVYALTGALGKHAYNESGLETKTQLSLESGGDMSISLLPLWYVGGKCNEMSVEPFVWMA